MAIKGKGRSKRRGVAAAPKPVYVQPKRPLFARRGVWIPAVAIIVIGTVAGVMTGLLIQHHNNQQKADALKLSGKATGPLQKELIAHTQNLLAAAARVFNHGYQKLINERAKFNLLVPVNPSQQTSPPAVIPTAPVVPSAVPSAAP